MTRREQREGIRGRHLLPPTPDDLARDLLAEIAACYAHVPLSAPVACGHAYLAAVRRALAAEAQVVELSDPEPLTMDWLEAHVSGLCVACNRDYAAKADGSCKVWPSPVTTGALVIQVRGDLGDGLWACRTRGEARRVLFVGGLWPTGKVDRAAAQSELLARVTREEDE